jgi:predicted CxxxxCH...CXXCH cytochrome family protein
MGFNYSTNEAHWSLYNTSEQNPLMGGANEACVSCHTSYDISITFSRPDYYEFIIDYGTGTLDGGALNGTPDRLVISGLADVTNFVDADNIFWRDTNSDSDWDPDEDIFRDEGDTTYGAGDTILYVGANGQDSFGAAMEFFGNEGEIFYLDSDHDGSYDYTSSTEEPLVFVGTDSGSISNDAKLDFNHEVLKPASGITWVTDAVKFASTDYYFLDNATGVPGTFDKGEPIVLDDGNGIIEAGILSGAGSADDIITSGYPDLRSFIGADNVDFRDENSNTFWDNEEDIFFDADDDDTFDYYGSVFDSILFVGSSFSTSHGNGLTAMTSTLKYIDSDHSGNYTLGEPIVNSTNLILDDADELLLREDDIYDNGTKVFGLWDFDQNPFTMEFFIDNNNNGVYDDGEAIIRETYRISGNTSSGVEVSVGNITASTDASGLHVYRNGSRVWDTGSGKSLCGDLNLGCHQDVYNAINDDNGGGHYTNSTLSGHLETSTCAYCHKDSDEIDPDNDHTDAVTGSWHSAKRISCAFEGSCHSTLLTGGLMQEVFLEINKFDPPVKGDFCWSCHRGDFDWSDPTGKTFRVYVEDDTAYQQVNIDATTVYAPTNYNSCVCHDDTISNVPEVPVGSGKYADHSTNAPSFYDKCTKCHADTADPHDDSHTISIDWSTWESDYNAIPPDFCSTTCHYSVNDARPQYIDTNTSWMAIEYSNWITNGGKHSLSTLLGGDNLTAGSVSCTEYCHTTHSTVPSCDNSGCHLDNDALSTKRDVPDSHDSISPGTIDSNRFPCARTSCHSGGGHDPVVAGGCHSTGGYGCSPNTNGHPTHAVPANKTYAFDCTECHYDSTVGYNSGQGTYGGGNHMNGVVNVGFDVTANGVATYGGVLTGGNLPTYAGNGLTCSQTYCHSNGNVSDSSPPGGGFLTYESPGWNSSDTTACGDCHGIPNYYNGTAWREMGGSVTLNTITHLKHTRNNGTWYTARNLSWVDKAGNASDTTPPFGWEDSIFDSDEAIIQDGNGNRMLDYGVLNGGDNQAASTPQSPDSVYVAGKADLRDFGNDVWFWDSNSNGDWDRDEDLYVEVGGGGNAGDELNPSKGDYLIYQGVNANITLNDNTNTVLYTSAGNGT